MGREVLFEGKYIRLIRQGTWEFTERVRATGVVMIVPVTLDNKVILVEQHRPAVKKQVIELPAGLVDDLEHCSGESFENAAIRELLEETGYKAESMEFIMCGPHAAGSNTALIHFYKAIGLKKEAQGGGVGEEDITTHEVPLNEVQNWLQKKSNEGYLIDPKLYAGLYFFEHSIQHKLT